MNTKFDYLHIKKHNVPGWQSQWYNLLDGRFIVENNELVEDQNAPIFRLGFTVAEVAEAIDREGYTSRQLDWYKAQPERYSLAGDQYVQVEGWAENYAKARRLKAIDEKLAEIDRAVAAELKKPFTFGGHNFYLDIEYIQGVYSALPLLPANWSKDWKSADKPDGINNTYVTMDKAGIQGLAMAALQRKDAVWSAGDALKKAVKMQATAEQIEVFEVAM